VTLHGGVLDDAEQINPMSKSKKRRPFAVLAIVLIATTALLIAWVANWWNRPRAIRIERIESLAEHSDGFTVAAFSPDGKLLAASDFKHNRRIPTEVIVWQIGEPTSQYCIFEGPETQCHALCFHPAGRLLAIGGEGGFVKIADVEEQSIMHTFEIHGGPPTPEMGIDIRSVRAMAFSPDGKVLAIATGRREIEIWSTRYWQRLRTLPRHGGAIPPTASRIADDEVNDLAFSADGARMLSVGGCWKSISNTQSMRRRPEIFEWDTKSWKKVNELEIPDSTGYARRVTYLGDGVAAVGIGRNITLINTASCKVVDSLDAHENLINDLAFDRSRDMLISVSAERTIVWDTWALDQAASCDGAGFLAYDPTDGIIATAFARSFKTITLSSVLIDE
jgi:WD40 repeat protein